VGYGPFDDDGNDRLSSIAQLIIFLALLYGLVNIAGDVTDFVAFLIPICILLPMSYAPRPPVLPRPYLALWRKAIIGCSTY
jgi:hypothetical protein